MHEVCEPEVVKYCLSTSGILALKTVFLNKPLTSGILFSTLPISVSRTLVVAKPLTSGI